MSNRIPNALNVVSKEDRDKLVALWKQCVAPLEKVEKQPELFTKDIIMSQNSIYKKYLDFYYELAEKYSFNPRIMGIDSVTNEIREYE